MKNTTPVRSLLLASILACSVAATTLLATPQNGPKNNGNGPNAPPPPPGQIAPPEDGNPPPPPPPPGGNGRQGNGRQPGDGPQGQGEGRGPGGGRFNGQGGQGGMQNIGRSMNGMNRAITRLMGQVEDTSKKEENLMLISDAQRSCVMAKMAPVPGNILDGAKDETGKDKIKAGIRAHLISALKLMIETEESIAADKTDAAKASLDKLVKLRDETHKMLGVSADEPEDQQQQ